MKIKQIDSDKILFDNGNEITFNHCPDCCEWNYADFEQLDDIAKNANFNPNLKFEPVNGSGFRFGNKPNNMYFVPCYSQQNGYYSTDIEIYYNGKQVLVFDAEFVYV